MVVGSNPTPPVHGPSKRQGGKRCEQAQPYASKTAWTALALMDVSLAAAIGGAIWGVRRAEHQLVPSRP
jgi:hypothetical protein